MMSVRSADRSLHDLLSSASRKFDATFSICSVRGAVLSEGAPKLDGTISMMPSPDRIFLVTIR
jgi:hypothetical protein